jgi:hypothetical protein
MPWRWINKYNVLLMAVVDVVEQQESLVDVVHVLLLRLRCQSGLRRVHSRGLGHLVVGIMLEEEEGHRVVWPLQPPHKRLLVLLHVP